MRATTITRLAARAGMTTEVRADRGPGRNRRPRREFLNKEVAKISKRAIRVHTAALASFERYGQLIRAWDKYPFFGISVYIGSQSCFFARIRASAVPLKHGSARQGLTSKTVEQGRTEETEGSPLSLFAPVL
jgi:hypothetical protein